MGTWERRQFDHYSLSYWSAPAGAEQVRVLIECFMGASGEQFVGKILFVDAARPARKDGDQFVIYYAMSRYPHIIDVLREEKPLYLNVLLPEGLGWVSTAIAGDPAGYEPIGEKELVETTPT
jgi:hypothetical protein